VGLFEVLGHGALDRRSVFIFFSFLVSMSLMAPFFDAFKYLKYFVGPLSIAAFFLGGYRIAKSEVGRVEVAFVFLIVYGLLTIMVSPDKLLGLKDLFFLASYVLPISLVLKRGGLSDGDVRRIFYVFSMFFMVSNLGKTYAGFSISASVAPFEGPESFVFGAFLLYFMILKDKSSFVLSLFFLFLSLKRVALLGVFVGAFIWFVPLVWKVLESRRVVVLLGNILFIFLLYLLVDGYFNDIVERYAGMGVTELTMGRVGHYVGVLDRVGQNVITFIFGGGAGSTYELAMEYDYFERVGGNLHSDTLKIFYEYGFLVFCVFFLTLSTARGKGAFVLVVYMMCLFFTDNVIIYVSVLFFVLLLIKQLEFRSIRDGFKESNHLV